ncbi:MAG: Ribonuclease D [Bacteroidales bacterium]|jgi:GAF domain-containing protein|nr:Ribonuclease D [Bacteroidales bacterium]MCZ2416431.1 GAF domain-containing protein [Burkholderiales bacterium]NLZ08562.1 GAF domain-containing protein [Bacteroidales bacterium]OQC56412.1 MAG: Free methionine-R-sulfoxide reductase [Bacteroidetes bacterium ADurb.Bin013]
MFASTIENNVLELLPHVEFRGQITTVTTKSQVLFAVQYLSDQPVLGFDTETRPRFSSGRMYMPALLQLSDGNRAFLIHLKKTGLPPEIQAILSNPAIIKAGAAIKDDIAGLQRYASFEPAGFTDLQDMVREYGIVEKSVKKMSAIILGKRISKSQQITNWEAYPLSNAQAIYAATDAYVCYCIYNKLIAHSNEKKTPRQRMYEEILVSADSLLRDESDHVANMANVSALIKEKFNFWWVGFYRVDSKAKELILGPFQGPAACTRIPFGRGVCGTCWQQRKTIIVPDVEKFPGHIACSSRSRSEIVVPVFDRERNVRAVLDIDSEKINTFDQMDRQYLEELTGLFKNNY